MSPMEMPEDNKSQLWAQLTEKEKVDVLLNLGNELRDQIHHFESLANKVAFYVC
jgi:hypothetical protein